MTLSGLHQKMLRDDSGISPEVIEARSYRTITDEKKLIPLGFSPQQRRVPGLLIPQFAPDGTNGLHQYRPDFPRQRRGKNGELKDGFIKYETPKGSGLRLDTPPICLDKLKDPSIRLWVTEGTKKADALASRGECAISLSGVYGFKGKNEFGSITLSADWNSIALKDREVGVVFDSDVMTKHQVARALELLTEHLKRKGANVAHVYLPGGRDDKVGVDDFLVTHSIEELEALVDAPRPQPKPAPVAVELLDQAPPAMRRPLSIIGDHAYAAIWPYTKTTVSETVAKDGKIVRHSPPLVEQQRRLCIVRDDGAIFGDGGRDLSDLGFEVFLSEIPPDDRLWSTPDVKRFVAGERVDPAELFKRLVSVVDVFIDFDRSTSSQRDMCEFVACYILASWSLDAFNVAGFLWPNGMKGSGKTQLLYLIADLGYLGELILAGGSYASLRDLADYGAMLCFDDAENLSDPKKTDPDKRALLLAGNRRGSTVSIKEPAGDRAWKTRHINTYCPRAFSAIRSPDDVLSSRTIIVPLVRTGDRRKANLDPANERSWPHPKRQIIDNLWSLALSNLTRMPAYDDRVAEAAALQGRALEPWRATLAVALWLDDQGVTGLWSRMDKLSQAYQSEREGFDTGDLTPLVVQALCKCAGVDVLDIVDVLPRDIDQFITTKEITDEVKGLVEETEADINLEKLNSRRIGWVLKKLRLRKDRAFRNTKRGWQVTGVELKSLVLRYSLDTSGKTSTTSTTSTGDAEDAAEDFVV